MRSIIGFGYRNIAKPFLFLQDPEDVHDRMISLGERLGGKKSAKNLFSRIFSYEDAALGMDIAGIHFKNPVGLAAGFDKNARLTQILPSIGFGFEEIGSITLNPCPGNPRPRLYRLPKSQGIIVNYGLANWGADKILENLSLLNFDFPLGISIAKTNSKEITTKEAGIADYKGCFEKVIKSNIGDYITLNISCPNTYGGEPFTDPALLKDLFTGLGVLLASKPVFVKMPADIGRENLGKLLDICTEYPIKGAILTNLAKDRTSPSIDREEIGKAIPWGGISGKPVFAKSNDLVSFAYKNFGKKLAIIGCGGIFNAEDAYKKIKLGASLVQLITGLIFRGPQLAGEINRGLVSLLRRDGFHNIKDAVGAEAG